MKFGIFYEMQLSPKFHANIPAHEAWKKDALAGLISFEEIDTAQFIERYGAKSVKV